MAILTIVLYTLCLFCHCVSGIWHTEIFVEEGEREGSEIYHVGDGWYYHYSRGDEEKSYYTCVKFKTKGCTGRAVFHQGKGMRHSQRHQGHERDCYATQVLALRHNILQRCRDLDYASFSQIFRQERSRFPIEVASRLTLASMRTSMWRARQSNYPPIPNSLLGLTELLNDPRYRVLTITLHGLDNVHAGSVTDENGDHHLLLASNRMLRVLSHASVLFSDGTFQIVPSLQSLRNRRAQIFNIMTTYRGHSLLLASAIMESRTEQAYTAVLSLLRNLLPAWRFNRVICDNEAAEINAWDAVFNPDVVQSCLWHTCRAFVIEIALLGLGHWFRDPQFPQFSSIVRMVCALPLLPPPLLRLGLRIVRQEARMQGGHLLLNLMTPFFNYIDLNWVDNVRRRRHMSVYNSEHRTNNICESGNARMFATFGRHPNIFRFLAGFVEMEHDAFTDYHTLNRGLQASRARKSTAVMNDRVIQTLTAELRRPPMGLNDAVRRFLLAASERVRNIVDNHVRNHI